MSEQLAASHWKRMAHLAVAYRQPGCDHPLRAFLTRAYIADGKLYSGKPPPPHRQKHARDDEAERLEQEQQPVDGEDSLEPDAGDAPNDEAAAAAAAAQCDDGLAERLVDLCISADSGAACDDAMVQNSGGDDDEVDEAEAEEDEELRLMAQLGLPTNFAVHQRRQGRQPRRSNKRQHPAKPDSAPGIASSAAAAASTAAEAASAAAPSGSGDSPKRRRSADGSALDAAARAMQDDEEKDAEEDAAMQAADAGDVGGDSGRVYAGPHWPEYEWIAQEFERHWAACRERCIWLAWVRRYGRCMTDETWSGMPPSLRDDEEFLQLRRQLQEQPEAMEEEAPTGLPVQDWALEWQRNDERAYWAEMLRFVGRYRPGRAGRLAAMKLARKLGFAYAAGADLDQVAASQYEVLPGGETVSRVQYKYDPTMRRDPEQEAAEAEHALRDPALNKYWNQRYRFFDRFDEGIRLDREAWFSVTPQRIARHQAERLRCPGGLVVDAFCGAGGNAIQFAQQAGHVLAIDIDAERLAMAEHNAGVYGLAQRVSFLCADFFHAMPHLAGRADAVFLSPPWGGPGYLERDSFDLDAPLLSGGRRSIADCVRAALAHCPNVAIYLPRNADLGQLARLLAQCQAGIVELEQNLLNGRLKAITVYTGCLVDAVTEDY